MRIASSDAVALVATSAVGCLVGLGHFIKLPTAGWEIKPLSCPNAFGLGLDGLPGLQCQTVAWCVVLLRLNL